MDVYGFDYPAWVMIKYGLEVLRSLVHLIRDTGDYKVTGKWTTSSHLNTSSAK